jgi:hypothetical protein
LPCNDDKTNVLFCQWLGDFPGTPPEHGVKVHQLLIFTAKVRRSRRFFKRFLCVLSGFAVPFSKPLEPPSDFRTPCPTEGSRRRQKPLRAIIFLTHPTIGTRQRLAQGDAVPCPLYPAGTVRGPSAGMICVVPTNIVQGNKFSKTGGLG